MELEKQNWLTIEPYCYIATKEKKAIIYNTFSKKSIVVENSEIIKLLVQLNKPENGRVVIVEKDKFGNEEIIKFVACIKDNFMGDIVETTNTTTRPFQLIAYPFFEKSIDKIKRESDFSYYFSLDINQFINEIFFYINSTCGINCSYCNAIYKQTEFCSTFNQEANEIGFQYIERFLKELFVTKNVKVNIAGGDIFQYSDFNRLLNLLYENCTRISFCSHYLNFPSVLNYQQKLNRIANIEFVLLVNFPLLEEEFAHTIKIIKKLKYEYRVKFVIASENEFNQAERLKTKYNITNFEMAPYYTGKNHCFLEESVCLTEKDLESNSLEMRDIFLNMSVNSLDFGKLIVDPQGFVYGNVNFDEIGSIKKSNPFDLIRTEIREGETWRRTRDSYPCNDCVYQYLCPPPSNLEIAMNKKTICLKN
jgi:pseudo-rSAM protein